MSSMACTFWLNVNAWSETMAYSPRMAASLSRSASSMRMRSVRSVMTAIAPSTCPLRQRGAEVMKAYTALPSALSSRVS